VEKAGGIILVRCNVSRITLFLSLYINDKFLLEGSIMDAIADRAFQEKQHNVSQGMLNQSICHGRIG